MNICNMPDLKMFLHNRYIPSYHVALDNPAAINKMDLLNQCNNAYLSSGFGDLWDCSSAPSCHYQNEWQMNKIVHGHLNHFLKFKEIKWENQTKMLPRAFAATYIQEYISSW